MMGGRQGERSNLIEGRDRACWLKGYYKAATSSDLIENSVAMNRRDMGNEKEPGGSEAV